ncbi:MAG: hypothetical protein J6N53_05975 [Lachnospiraceae bacterium]|nr:hypothetical protein [Lachnospiraceae bacterium]
MAYIKQYHKDTDTTYVYESESYWDPEKKQARSRRKVVGKLDPVTGEIIPTGKRGRKKKDVTATEETNGTAESRQLSLQYEDAKRTLDRQEQLILSQKEEIRNLKEKLTRAESQNRSLQQALKKISAILDGLSL